jgi:TRAP-type C4-dicarboxylate transport system substrate-binding protein
MFGRWLALVLQIALASPAAAQAPAAAPELKLSTALGPAYAQGKAGEIWAQLIRERSAGRLPVRHFPGATLIQRDAAREFGALRDGGVDLAVGSTLAWAAQVPQLNLPALPWLIPNDTQLDALLDGEVGSRLATSVEAAGVVALAWAANGFTALATRGPIRKPADLQGLKLRVQDASLALDLIAGLGAQGSTMAAAQARAAFAQGALDGTETSIPAYTASRLDAAGLTHLLLWDARADVLVFAVNRRRWDGWSESDRALVRQAAQDAAREAGAVARRAADADAMAVLARQGVNVTRLTPAGKDAFRAAARTVFERWAGAVGWDLVRAADPAVEEPKLAPKQ